MNKPELPIAVPRTLLAGLAAGFVALGASPGAADAKAGDVKAGVDAWSAGDYTGAISQWRPLADKGDPDALFNLAQAYKMGRGVPVDLERAKQLYGAAAAKGHVQAADNYGLLLFQDGEREKAMPYLEASAARGDPRAQYILGIAHFNGDFVTKDWVRAYALLTLAREAELPQATGALAQMDTHIPLDQRQEGVALARTLATQAAANRNRLATASELNTPGQTTAASIKLASTSPATRPTTSPPPARSGNFTPAGSNVRASSPAEAGADYARPQVESWPAPRVETTSAKAASTPLTPPAPSPARAPTKVAAREPTRTKDTPSTKPSPPPAPAPVAAKPASGPWQLQLGAFGVAGNAENLWQKVRARAEIRGHTKRTEPAGRLTKLLVTGYSSSQEAQDACRKLKAGGYDCLVTRD